MIRVATFPTLLLLTLISVGAIVGCPHKQPDPPEGDKFTTLADVRPDALPYQDASIILAGSPMEATLEEKREGDDVHFFIRMHGEVMEHERYRLTHNQFSFVGLGEESYEPPITLLTFPLTTGQTWEWKGEMRLGPLTKPAQATVTTASDTLNLAAGRFDAILVVVALSIDAGTNEQAKRELKFWFDPGKGIVRREFAASSTREPRPPADAEPPAQP